MGIKGGNSEDPGGICNMGWNESRERESEREKKNKMNDTQSNQRVCALDMALKGS